jgi:hypothetical protein
MFFFVNVIVNVFFRECYPIRVTNNMGRMGNIYDNIHELCLERNYFIYRQYLLTLMVLCREWLEPIGYSCNGGYRCQMETRFRQK